MSLTDYPFGKIVLKSDFQDSEDYRRYLRNRSVVAQYHIQDRHPFLKGLEGAFPVEAMLPTWWKNVLNDETLSFDKRLVLSTVSGIDFREGKVSERRLKALRAVLSSEEKKDIPASPSIAKWLQGTSWYNEYNDRGTKDANIELRITARPEDIFYMSNGTGWTSCQHFRNGDMNDHLMGAMHEPCLAMGYLINKDDLISGGNGDRHKGTILARALLRMVYIEGSEVPSVLIDRAYGLDGGTIDRFIMMLGNHFKERCISHCRVRSSYEYTEPYMVATPTFAVPYHIGVSYLDTMAQQSQNIRGETSFFRLACRANFRSDDSSVLSLTDFDSLDDGRDTECDDSDYEEDF